jgi:hypothetical protein
LIEAETFDKFSPAQRLVNAVGVHFVMHELELGLVSCHMASLAATTREAQRSQRRAKRSHRIAVDHVVSLYLTTGERSAFNFKSLRLETQLAAFV